MIRAAKQPASEENPPSQVSESPLTRESEQGSTCRLGLHAFLIRKLSCCWGQEITESATRCRFESTFQLGSTDAKAKLACIASIQLLYYMHDIHCMDRKYCSCRNDRLMHTISPLQLDSKVSRSVALGRKT
jgi:hypothetical protein